MVNGREVEDVEEFPYLGATVDKEGGDSKDIISRLQKARRAFQRLRKVWAVRGIGKGTKMRLLIQDFNSTGPATWLRNVEDHKG